MQSTAQQIYILKRALARGDRRLDQRDEIVDELLTLGGYLTGDPRTTIEEMSELVKDEDALVWLKSRSRVAYIHVPKTGGTYVARACPEVRHLEHSIIDDASLGDRLNWSPPLHPLAVSGRHVFATVRNVYPLLVSFYVMRTAEQVKAYGTDLGSFTHFLRNLADEGDRHWARYGKSFMFCQLFKTSGTLVVDYIARQETLDADLSYLSEEWEFPSYEPGDRENEGVYAKPWKSYYTPAVKRYVDEHWGRELRMFGFSLNGETEPMLGRIVTDEDRENWRYDFETDVLTYKGEVL